MKVINFNQSNYYPKFKSSIPEYKDDGVLGCSDTFSQLQRERFRREDYPHTIPEVNSLSYGGTLSDRELRDMLDYLAPKHDKSKVIDRESIFSLSSKRIYRAFPPIDGKDFNVYRGSTLYGSSPEVYETVKNAGVETVIDLSDFGKDYKEEIENAGMKYYSYPIRLYVWNNSRRDRKFQKDKLIDFIKTVQEGNIYIGCSSGSWQTGHAMMLNNLFNPQIRDRAKMLPEERFNHLETIYDFAEEVYPYMTEEDKKSIGWTPEFEERFKRKINNFNSSETPFFC